jgi:hypothetical protein
MGKLKRKSYPPRITRSNHAFFAGCFQLFLLVRRDNGAFTNTSQGRPWLFDLVHMPKPKERAFFAWLGPVITHDKQFSQRGTRFISSLRRDN